MGNILGSEKPLKDVIRENQRLIKKSIRELEKEITNMERNQKKLESDIKKHAKLNQMGAVKVMVKDYVRTKNYITKFIEMKTHLNAVNLKMQVSKPKKFLFLIETYFIYYCDCYRLSNHMKQWHKP